MRRNTATIAGAIAVAVLSSILTVAAPASATEYAALDQAVSTQLEIKLLNLAQQSGSQVSISGVSVDVSPQLVAAAGSDEPPKVAEYIFAEVKRRAKDAQAPTSNPAAEAASEPKQKEQMSATRKTVRYTADQSTVLPALGIAWVNQDMSVTFSGNTISSVKLQGSSYGTGVSVFAYSHISTAISYSGGKTCLLTRMKGTFSAVVKGSAVAFAASVLAADGPRGGKMVNLNTNNC